MKKEFIVIFLGITCLFFLGNCTSDPSDKLVIATAANMQFAIRALAEEFSKETGITCEPIIGSSGKLTAQIKEGAPFDIFVSANLKYPEDLYQNGLTYNPPTIYAYGKLVLWTLEKDWEPTLEMLSTSPIKHLALANPRNAPYGKAALEVMEKHQIFSGLESKLVYGESISQTNQFIRSQVAQIGFTAKSVVLSPFLLGAGQWKEMNQEDYTPIAQGIVILKNKNSRKKQSEKFKHFLFSSKGKQILSKFGYSTAN